MPNKRRPIDSTHLRGAQEAHNMARRKLTEHVEGALRSGKKPGEIGGHNILEEYHATRGKVNAFHGGRPIRKNTKKKNN